MTDVERRITDALRGAAADAPSAAGLADAARVRRSRRRRTTAWTSAAGVVAVAAVVGGVALLGSRGDDGTTTVADEVPTPAPTTRVETWRDVSVTVPSGWGHGSLSTWCIAGSEPSDPVVERPGGVVEDILCTPTFGYGVQFSEGAAAGFEAFSPGTVNESVGDDYPKGSWQGWDQVGRSRVLVVAPTQEDAEQVLGSFEEVRGADANGCAPHAEGVTMAVDGTLRLCRYSSDGWLEQSELLTGRDASGAVAALDSAPVSPAKPCPNPQASFVMVTSEDESGQVNLDACAAASWGDHHRALTGDVLHWVLSPGWSGQVPEGITFQPRS